MAGSAPPQAPFILYICAVTLFGAINSLTSPVLPELEEQAAVDEAGAAKIFVCRGLGSMAGALAVGFALDAVRSPHTVLAAMFAARACAELAMPYGWSVELVGLNLAVVAFCGNAITTTCSTSIAWTYGKLMGPQMNLMDSVFGIGGCLAPPLASVLTAAGSPAIFGYWVFAGFDAVLIVASMAIPAGPNPQFAVGGHGAAKATPRAEKGGKEYSELPADDDDADDDTIVRWAAVLLCAALILCAGVCEGCLAFWCYTYAVQELGLSPGSARTLNTVYWSGYTATRLFLTWLVQRVKPAVILQWSVAVAFVAAIIMRVPSAEGSMVPCIAFVAVGCGIAGLHANAIAVLREASFISGRAQGVIRVGSSLGNMLGASSVGFLGHWQFFGGSALPLPAVLIAGLTMEAILLALLLRRTPSAEDS